jgi:hypothetical protein
MAVSVFTGGGTTGAEVFLSVSTSPLVPSPTRPAIQAGTGLLSKPARGRGLMNRISKVLLLYLPHQFHIYPGLIKGNLIAVRTGNMSAVGVMLMASAGVCDYHL